ncbi:hypothetical protein AAG747_11560 [Rapidithrix thailandica]|uniref:Uncharacterized protein n=1 Tax=Rapidithrix thailandica TaxID=413964 RepID=A0AAW9S669_9BACT
MAQDPIEGYTKIATLSASDFDGKAYKVLVSSDNKYIFIKHGNDNKSRALTVYRFGSWEKLYDIRLRGNFISLQEAYMDEEKKYFYVRISNETTFYQIDLNNGNDKKLPCKKTPKGCIVFKAASFGSILEDVYKHQSAYVFTRDKSNPKLVTVYGSKPH